MNAAILEAHNVACVRGDQVLFQEINCSVQAGEALRVTGVNGSGKTSLLRIMCGLTAPTEGSVLWGGVSIQKVRDEFHRDLLYLGHAHGMKDDLLSWENIVMSAGLSGRPVDRRQVCQVLEQAGLEAVIDLPARVLSQGQRKRVALARLRLEQNVALWILDEPFSALDQVAVTDLVQVLNQHVARGGRVVYTTHQDVLLSASRTMVVNLDREAVC